MIWKECTADDRLTIRHHLKIEDRLTAHKAVNMAKRMAAVIRSTAVEGGYVYFVQCEKFCKIGHSTRPRSRFSALCVSNPHELYLLGIAPGGVSTEQALHKMFEDRHHRYEWFHLDQTLQLAAAVLCWEHEMVDIPGDAKHRFGSDALLPSAVRWMRVPKSLEETMVGGEVFETPTFSV